MANNPIRLVLRAEMPRRISQGIINAIPNKLRNITDSRTCMSTETFLTDTIEIVKKKPANVIQKAAIAGAGISLNFK
ncbi:MAG: hypothetical protein CMM53_01155 [Rhodospirillaceae bacterium]|nr:hypothetical protein [Rhodospirillaceae bacterium]